VKNTEFQVFQKIMHAKGEIRGIKIPGGNSLSRSQIDTLTKDIQSYGAKGLVWIRKNQNTLSSSIEKFLSQNELENISAALELQDQDLGLIVADQPSIARSSLSQIKSDVLSKMNYPVDHPWAFLWVEDFPLFEYDAEQKRYVSIHHPFTSPHPEDLSNVMEKKNLSSIRSNAYDLVLNGYEIGGGSIRIHQNELQQIIFSILGLAEAEAKEKFGFFLEALQYGTPPHGGIALGLDRIAMLLAKSDSLRDIIAFPKTQNAYDLMVDAPSTISIDQLLELHLSLLEKKGSSS